MIVIRNCPKIKYVSLSRLTLVFGDVSLERPTYKNG